jgi:hypothetical protein
MNPPRFLTYANVASTLALVVAMGVGTSYAASQLPKNSVSAKQIKDNAVRSPEIKDGAVTSSDVADGTLTGNDIANGTLSGADLDATSLAALRAPRAYGVVTSSGALLPGQSKNATVKKVTTTQGDYCVTPDPSTGITNKNSVILLTADFEDGIDLLHSAMTYDVVSQSTDCPAGFEVQTVAYVDADKAPFKTDVAFTFVIP